MEVERYRVTVGPSLSLIPSDEVRVFWRSDVNDHDGKPYWGCLETFTISPLPFKPIDVRLEAAVRKAVAFVLEREGVKATEAELTRKANELFAKMIADATKEAK